MYLDFTARRAYLGVQDLGGQEDRRGGFLHFQSEALQDTLAGILFNHMRCIRP